jgi:hypothetical protein
MNFFITSETTVDVTEEELSLLRVLDYKLNNISRGWKVSGVDTIGIVVIIMNPDICLPFPPGAIFRRSKQMLDLKPLVNYRLWKDSSKGKRLCLVRDSTLTLIKTLGRKRLSNSDGNILEDIFNRAISEINLEQLR